MALWTNNGKWEKLGLHESMSGVPAIIACNGPSLKSVQSSEVRGPGRVVIGVNNSYPTIKPDWWVGMDDCECYDARVFCEAFPKVVRRCHHDGVLGFPSVMVPDLRDDVTFYDGESDSVWRWDKDTFRVAIQLALYLGARTIALAGVDLSTINGDYSDGDYLEPLQRSYNQVLYDGTFRFLEWHLRARPEIKFVSCSPDSRINDLMPFAELSEFIQTCEHPLPSGRKKGHVLSKVTE